MCGFINSPLANPNGSDYLHQNEQKEQPEMKEATITYYDDRYYDKRVKNLTNLNSYFQKYRISKVLQIYTPKKNESVLDLGCGWGTFCFAVAPLCQEVTGLDFSRKSIVLCNQLLAKSGYSNIKLVCADAQNTGLGFESYDMIICADVVEHLYPEAFENVLNECRRLLKPGGKIVIWTPHRGHLLEILRSHHILLKPDITHVDYKSMACLLESLHRRRFSIQKAYYTESHLPAFCYLEKLLLPPLRCPSCADGSPF